MSKREQQRCLDAVGKLAMTKLRDRGFEHFEKLAAGTMRAPELQELQSNLARLEPDIVELVRHCVRSSVDSALHDFLFAIHERRDAVSVVVDGVDVAEMSDGLHGELFGTSGWIAKFSRYPDSDG